MGSHVIHTHTEPNSKVNLTLPRFPSHGALKVTTSIFKGKKPKHTKRSCLWGTNLNSYFWISSVRHPPFWLWVNVGCSPSPAPTPLPLIFHPKPLVSMALNNGSEEWHRRTQASPLSKQSGGRPGRLPTICLENQVLPSQEAGPESC